MLTSLALPLLPHVRLFLAYVESLVERLFLQEILSERVDHRLTWQNLSCFGTRYNSLQAILWRTLTSNTQIQTNNRKRRSVSHTRQTSRSYSVSAIRPKASWMRFGKPFGGKQYH